MTPQQHIFFYDPDEWELFIREWATGLGDPCVQIKRLGGPNDRGVDVAGFETGTATTVKAGSLLPEALNFFGELRQLEPGVRGGR